MLNDKQVQELFESAIALVEHDGYKVPDCLNRKVGYNRCKKAYGYCKGKRKGTELVSVEISVSKYFAQGATEAQMFGVLVHELIHSWAFTVGEFGHKGVWKAAAERISSLHNGLDIKRCDNLKDDDGNEILAACAPKRQVHKSYVITCPDCSKQWVYHRNCKVVQHAKYLHCPYCNCYGLNMQYNNL